MRQKKVENTDFSVLNTISSEQDVKQVPKEQLPRLAEEIRDELVRTVTKNGGHLASNLGVVELTIALHRVFTTPKDHILFDVGHQSYIHKMLTGRKDRMDTLRQPGGLSGFETRKESEHDCFGTGHASTSLSAALGFAYSDRMSGSDAYTVAVVGDGAFTGGMIHEALNNCDPDLRLVIVLNENEMSISKNIGRFAKSLAYWRLRSSYIHTKAVTESFFSHIPLIGKPLLRGMKNFKKSLKNHLYGSNYFEDLGLKYMGPIDGNDEESVERALSEAKKAEKSVILHIQTKKGKGYEPAEESPEVYHGMPPFAKTTSQSTFSAEFGQCLMQLAKENDKICAITAAMSDGTGLEGFKEAYPDRFFDVGIAEEHAVTFAAGLAANGYRPVFAVYSTFLQRAYDNLIHDVALQNLPCVFCIDRAGLNGYDGPTHHGIYDVSFLSQIPGMKIFTPISYASLKAALKQALSEKTSCAVRYPSGAENENMIRRFYPEGQGDGLKIRADYDPKKEEPEVLIITYGRIVSEAVKAADRLKEQSVRAGILLLEYLAPYKTLAEEILPYLTGSVRQIVFYEEGMMVGGMGMCLSRVLYEKGVLSHIPYDVLAIREDIYTRDAAEDVYRSAGIGADELQKVIEERLNRGKEPPKE